MFRAAVLGLVALALSSCATLQGTKPETPREALAAAEITLNGAIVTVASLHQAGIISTETVAEDFIPKLQRADALIKSAALVIKSGVDPSGTEIKKAIAALQLALAIAYEIAGDIADIEDGRKFE